MQNAARRVKFSTKSWQSCRPPSRLPVGRTYATATGLPRQSTQHTALLLAGTAVLSAAAGYLLAIRETEKLDGSGTVFNARYGTPGDFRRAIEELKTTFPEPGAVSDDPVVVAPYGFSQNDYHPGKPRRSL